MTRSFCFGDMHGRPDVLKRLLKEAGIIDEDNRRISNEYMVFSIGDLTSCTLTDVDNDKEIMKFAEDVLDYWVIGNHEAPYFYPHLAFEGFHKNGEIKGLLDLWLRGGRMVPTILWGETLLTHAGVHKDFDFKTGEEAFDAIYDVWVNYQSYAIPKMSGMTYSQDRFNFENQSYGPIPKGSLIDGIPPGRGGGSRTGGILWTDWDEPKNKNFCQVVGHTPIKTGPKLHERVGAGTWVLNIDTGVKKGLVPYGVWLDENGQIMEYVTISEESKVDIS